MMTPATTTAERTRTFSWDDPMIPGQLAREMSGLEFLQAMIRGEIPRPPIAYTLNFQLTEIEEGRAVFTVEPAEYHYNPIGMVHGGLAATVMDSALGCAIQSTLVAGVYYSTLDINVNFIRSLRANMGIVRCEAEIIHVGRTTATAQARLLDAEGKLYAHATTTCIIFRPTEGNGS